MASSSSIALVPKVTKSYVGNWEWKSSDNNIRFSFQPRVASEFWWTLNIKKIDLQVTRNEF